VALVLEDKGKDGNRDEHCTFTTPVSTLLPDDFQLADLYSTVNVTIEDILSHRSGLPRHDDAIFGINAKEPDCPRSVTRILRNLPLSRPLRTTYQYCNLMYTAAAHLVSELSGVSFPDFLRDRIWNPLGMNDSYLNLPGTDQFEDMKLHMATGYYWSKDEEAFKPFPFFDQPEGLGAGSIFSTVSDYAKWVRCMLTQSQPLSKSSHEELINPRTIVEPEKSPKHGFGHTLYALGWEVHSYRGHRIIGHDGAVGGFGSTMKYIPDLNWGVILFANGDEGANDCIEAIAMTLIDQLIGVPQEDRLDWSKVNREESDKDEKDADAASDSEDDKDEERPNAAAIPLERYAGVYHNTGYRTIRLEFRDGHLYADCTDRCFQFHMVIRRKVGNRFRAEIRDALDDQTDSLPIKFELSERSGNVLRVGLGFMVGMELIWFDRVADP
jgi:CubicO group peptidase (beta-lactamase class C family)